VERRRLGNSGLELTRVGLGSWAIAGGGWKFGWGEQDDDEAVAALVRGVELGINWIDTAPVYGDGRAESLVARALERIGAAGRPLVATKFGRLIREDGEVVGCLKADSVRRECEASLRRLGVEAIDLYQMHWPDPEPDLEEGWTAAARLREQGLVREIGVSNANPAQMERLQRVHPIASLQPPYNMIVRHVEQRVLGFCAEHGIGVVAYSPMCKGLLSGRFTRERARSLAGNDHRSRDPKFAEPQLDLHLELVEALRPVAERHGRSVAELAIAWVLRRPEVTSAIVGARRPAQIEATAPAGGWALGEADRREVEGALERHATAMQELGAETGRV
jgi:aryl-alcohol dehydrogenase-like predicted oxidoreductase